MTSQWQTYPYNHNPRGFYDPVLVQKIVRKPATIKRNLKFKNTLLYFSEDKGIKPLKDFRI